MNDNVYSAFKEIYRQGLVESITALPTGDVHALSEATELFYVKIGNQLAPVELAVTLPNPVKGRKIKMIWDLGANLTMQFYDKDSVEFGDPLSGAGEVTIFCADETWYADIDTLSDSVMELAEGLQSLATDVGKYAGGANVVTDLSAAEGDIDDLKEVTTPAATQEITVDTDLTIDAPNYCLLTQINDPDSNDAVFVVTPPVVPHVSRIWTCEVVAVGTTTVTVELGDADITGLTDGARIVCYHDGVQWIALNNLFAAHA